MTADRNGGNIHLIMVYEPIGAANIGTKRPDPFDKLVTCTLTWAPNDEDPDVDDALSEIDFGCIISELVVGVAVTTQEVVVIPQFTYIITNEDGNRRSPAPLSPANVHDYEDANAVGVNDGDDC
ncbi:uncharacterized protein PgNI_02506 [Pyricularia grisea]|uniref:Uncharacterized protein n=1 Tax=Pyricularia grisea TaxID=148305 RepID=A0A6P8BIT1_PYRGI|nr:uncharacterized protein PgNI_02506 [Pyricularia grisea]TLD16683.1 hypothetical protein PgNI_02506 [Pyricularia grisea]